MFDNRTDISESEVEIIDSLASVNNQEESDEGLGLPRKMDLTSTQRWTLALVVRLIILYILEYYNLTHSFDHSLSFYYPPSHSFMPA